MPIVELTKRIEAPPDAVMDIALDIERFPEFMPDVKSLKVLERKEDRTYARSEWVGRIPQFGVTVRWEQEERWDFDKRRSDFRQLSGDYDKLEGYWEFREADGGTEFVAYLDYEYNVPLLGSLLKKVVHHIVKQNIDGIMEAIKKRAESD
ncbi:MAG: SRPBCC family protein [Armatimonadetes bacterium]|nr:SRPBCC family protein [Armatimonadota bacterium]